MGSNYFSGHIGRAKLVLGLVLLGTIMVVASPEKVLALPPPPLNTVPLNPDPGSPAFQQGPLLDNEIPNAIYVPMASCDATATPAAASTYPVWGSMSGQPWSTSTVASAGQTSVTFDLNIAIASCMNATDTGNQWLVAVADYFQSGTSNTPVGPGGTLTPAATPPRNYAGANVGIAGQFKGAYNRGTLPISYTPPGGSFTTSGWYDIHLVTSSIIAVYNATTGATKYLCGGQTTYEERFSLEDRPFECTAVPVDFRIWVDVTEDKAECGRFTVNTPNIRPGNPFSVTIEIKNTGTYTWVYPEWQLGSSPSQTNNFLNREERASVNPGNVPPGTLAIYTFTRDAPGSPGRKPYFWKMVHELVAWIPPECGGFIDVLPPLQTPPQVGCVGNVSFTEQEYGLTGTLTGNIRYISNPTGPANVDITTVSFSSPGMTIVPPPPDPVVDSDPLLNGQDTRITQQARFDAAGDYTVTMTVNYSYFINGVTTATSIIPPCTGPISLYAKPYLKAFGADVSAGGSFDPGSGQPCAATNKSIYAFATGSGANYRGASGQFGVTALLDIGQFYSSSQRTSANVPPKGTSFANTDAALTYGGNFGGNGTCIINYFDSTRNAAWADGNFKPAKITANKGRKQYNLLVADRTINAITIPLGTQVALYSSGDVFINGDAAGNGIIFAGGATTRSDMPNFALVVKGGNIYIGSNVKRLDGLYVAQPSNPLAPTKGKIYTCAFAPPRELYTEAAIATGCNNQLSINGALIAQEVKFYRTRGTLKDSGLREVPNFDTGLGGTNAAEVINFTPEMYLAPSALADPNNIFTGRYDAVFSLPPVL